MFTQVKVVQIPEKMYENEKEMEMDSDSTKRSHHNALERKRRDHIKESFNGLRDSVPSLSGEKASRAQILNKATEYIQSMTKKNQIFKSDIDELSKQNQEMENRIKLLEHAKQRGLVPPQSVTNGQQDEQATKPTQEHDS